MVDSALTWFLLLFGVVSALWLLLNKVVKYKEDKHMASEEEWERMKFESIDEWSWDGTK